MVRASAAYGKAHLLGDGLALERYVIPVLPDEGALHPVVEEGLGAGPVDLSAGTGLVVLARLDGHLHRAVRVGVGGNVVLARLDAQPALAALELDPLARGGRACGKERERLGNLDLAGVVVDLGVVSEGNRGGERERRYGEGRDQAGKHGCPAATSAHACLLSPMP